MCYLRLLLFVLLSLLPWRMGNTDCCLSTYVRFGVQPNEVCNNYVESHAFGWTDSCFNMLCGNLTKPTPCCGVGKCNIFCCNCDDGCIPGNVADSLMDKYGSNITIIAGGPELTQNITFTMKFNRTKVEGNNSVEANAVFTLPPA